MFSLIRSCHCLKKEQHMQAIFYYMHANYSILHADTYQHCDLQASASKTLIPEHVQLLKRVHDSTHHASFYRVAGATTVYCKCCQRNGSTHVAGSESSGHVSQRKVPMWHGHGTCSGESPRDAERGDLRKRKRAQLVAALGSFCMEAPACPDDVAEAATARTTARTARERSVQH